jgi:hypothetical protein
MEIVEGVKIFLLFVIAYEGFLFLIKGKQKKEEEKIDERASRRETYGIYRNPLGDSYRKNNKSQYVPIKPGEKMIENSGDDEE